MRRARWILLALLLVGLPAAAQHGSGCLDQGTIAQGAMSGADLSPGCEANCPGADLVIEDATSWAKLWARHTSNLIPPPPLPAVDFREQVVLASFLGERPSTSYGVNIDCISSSGLATIGAVPLTADVTDISPGANCIVQPALTNPFHFVVFDRPTGAFGPLRVSVTFEHDAYVIPCGGGNDPICRVCGGGGIGGGQPNQNINVNPIPCCP